MRHEIEIQNHAKVSDFIGHNDMIEKTAEEKELALALYKTRKWEAEQNGIKVIYVVAFTPNDVFIGGILWVDDKVQDYSHSEAQHKQFLGWF